MILFAEVFPDLEIVQSLMTQLGWTHFLHIIPMDNPLKRYFYAEMCRVQRWSNTATIMPELGRQLEREFGHGFGVRNGFRMVRFAELFSDKEIVSSLMTQLGWTRFLYIIRVDDWTGPRGQRKHDRPMPRSCSSRARVPRCGMAP